MDDSKNFLLFILLSLVLFLTFDAFFWGPQREAARQETTAQAPAQSAPAPASAPDMADGTTEDMRPQAAAGAVPQPGDTAPDAGGGVTAAADSVSLAKALEGSDRIVIDTPSLAGSIALTGGRIDDLTLKDYQVSVDEGAPNVRLLQPRGTPRGYYANTGWIASGSGQAVPDEGTRWQADGTRLTPDNPITLTWDNGQGLVFERRIEVDEDFLFTVTQRVRNTTGEPVTLAPYALANRRSKPDTRGFFILHEGAVGVLDGTLEEVGYDKMAKEGPISLQSTGGWLGITDKYWLVGLVPDQDMAVSARFVYSAAGGVPRYQTDFAGPAQTVAPGGDVHVTTRVFAGAKEVDILQRYQEAYGIDGFDQAVDWGWFYFLTRPVFWALHHIHALVGNFGVAILLLTVLIKALLYPLASKSYKSMARMREVAPKLKELQERYKDDRQRLNQEMMAIYQKEKINPAAGCLPILVQIPVFFSLYKVLFVTIEMRHQPGLFWVNDLSAPDPARIMTLFGYVPWDVPAILQLINVGVWPILMGISMYLITALNPQTATMDAMQKKIFLALPIFMVFVLNNFPAGLLIYWTWNTILSGLQQWVIMRRTHQEALRARGA
ncbi:membrane protein insertase YidC [Rhodothalassium salexigens]|uniref:membrane protein insertase YidC n=1 Tax=Rhodothalassium salexigens TaxID=1086 RepID=UPI0019132E24|nr:membrane protein insertase YidC [Rhodothalassium salexigens]MBK5909998.1 membrane protein insertase YidC [Rhodothalassium salexigens]